MKGFMLVAGFLAVASAQNKSVALWQIYGPPDPNNATRPVNPVDLEAFRQEVIDKLHKPISAAFPDWERVEKGYPVQDWWVVAKPWHLYMEYRLGGASVTDVDTACTKLFNDVLMNSQLGLKKVYHIYYKCNPNQGFGSITFNR
ncbi:hypothetical protein AAVH_17656 [Aphelenchoides avenae]|nr:hypothetical protein AAVH_17656 [Aphelenchus avenae]